MTMNNLVKTLALAGTVAALVPSAAHAEDPVTVGMALAESGWMVAYDGPPSAGALLAIEDINKTGGVLGRQLKAVAIDTRTDLARGAQAAQELLAAGAEVLLVSCDYDMGAPAALAAEGAGKISIFVCAADPKAGVQGIGPLSFSAYAAAFTEGATIGEWMAQKKQMKSAYVLLDTTIQYDRSQCAGFKWIASQLEGITIVGEDTFKNNDSAIASQITAIKSAAQKPDAIMLCSYLPGGASAIRQIRAAGIDIPILTGTAIDGDDWLGSVPGLKDFYGLSKGSVAGDDPRTEINDFVKRYTEHYGKPPVNQRVFDGYVAIQMWTKAVERAETFEAAKVTAALESFKDEPTLLGPRSFSSTQHIQSEFPFLVTSTKDGKIVIEDQWTVNREISMDLLLGQ